MDPLKVTGFIWIDDILDKLARKHGVQPNEVREVFHSRTQFRYVEKGHRPGENVYFAAGQTAAGRYLIVFFVHKKDGRALIVSARDMTRGERRQYER